MKKTILEGVFSQDGKPLAEGQLPEMAKAPYEAPVTTRTFVETEGSFCGSVIEPEDPNTQTGMTIEEHGFANPNLDYEVGATTGAEDQWTWDE